MAPCITVSGVRKSWDTEASRALRSCSVSVCRRAASSSWASCARLSACVSGWPRAVSRRRRAAGTVPPCFVRTPSRACGPSLPVNGSHHQRPLARVWVPRPLGWPCCQAHSAAARSPSRRGAERPASTCSTPAPSRPSRQKSRSCQWVSCCRAASSTAWRSVAAPSLRDSSSSAAVSAWVSRRASICRRWRAARLPVSTAMARKNSRVRMSAW
ncbi:hypothetical protein D3C81_1436240 [compost metagenome]